MRQAILLAVFVSCVNAADLAEATAWVRGLDEAALLKLVPEQSGLNFVGCPNCNGGRQEQQLVWSPERPGEIRCQHCAHRYPSEKYPMSRELKVRNPRGEVQHYPYWEDSRGYRYFFAARRDAAVREYLAAQTRNLALLYAQTGDRAHARRAALLLDRFAQVFPGWCYHYDYPFQQKIIYEGDVPPAEFRSGFRTARWTWWAYNDIPMALLEAYDAIRASGVIDARSRERIEHDLFRNAARQVLANPDAYSNMSPRMWHSLIEVGRVIGEPEYARESTRRLGEFTASQFFYDGVWHEGAPSYHAQTLGGLERVMRALGTGGGLEATAASLAAMVLPDGRYVPVHDTWAHVARKPPAETRPYLLPALGHACLGGGQGADQFQWHLTWSGGYGHQHGDLLSLLLFAGGHESLSDLGYTHTRYRSWTLATAAHNTVVIDEKNQLPGSVDAPTDGSMLLFDTRDSMVQAAAADAPRGYPQAELYRRTLLAIDAGQGQRYAVDLFEVRGGAMHDYFLHGDADHPTEPRTRLPLQPVALAPPGWQPTTNEGETRRIQEPRYAYGFLRNTRGAALAPGAPVAVTFEPGVRVTLLPEAESQLVIGENPAIRGAGEDDSRLESVRRSFLMVRRRAARSRFAAVIEPKPFIDAIEPVAAPGATLALKVRLGERTHIIVCGAPQPVAVGEARFQGECGVLALRGRAVEHAWALGEGGWTAPGFSMKGRPRRRAPLLGAEPGALLAAASPTAGDAIRLLMPDGWVYPYTVKSAAGGRVKVGEGPGFRFENRRVEFTSFPQRRHTGTPEVEWFGPTQ